MACGDLGASARGGNRDVRKLTFQKMNVCPDPLCHNLDLANGSFGAGTGRVIVRVGSLSG